MKEKESEPMTGEQILLAKFKACMVNTPLKCTPDLVRIERKLDEFDRDKFHALLVEHDMGKYSELLFKYIFNIIEIQELNRNSYEGYVINGQENTEYRSDLLKTLQFLLKEQQLDTKRIRLGKDKTTHFTVTNDRLITEIEMFLEKKYKENFLTMYSTLEIEVELKSKKNSKWISKWIEQTGIQNTSNGVDFYSDLIDERKYQVSEEGEELYGRDIKKKLISDFRRLHKKQPDLVLEAIDKLVIHYSKHGKPKRGQPRKNEFLILLATELSDLIRVNRFLSSVKTAVIDEIDLRKTDYLFIYECLDFWTLIPNLEKNNTSMPEDYMYQTMKQGTIYFDDEYYVERQRRLSSLKVQLADYN